MANTIGAKSWTREETQQLRRLHAEKLSDQQIAERLGRTTWSVANRRRRAGLPCHNPRNNTRCGKTTLWTRYEDEILHSMHADGASDAEISQRIGRSANACRIRRHLRGIVDTSRSSTPTVAPMNARQRQPIENKRHRAESDTDREQRIANARAINELRRQEAFRRQFGREPVY